jgi:hypothetical protein
VTHVTYEAGDTRHFAFDPGEFTVHDLENVGDSDLVFTTAEFLDSANAPLSIPRHARERQQRANQTATAFVPEPTPAMQARRWPTLFSPC